MVAPPPGIATMQRPLETSKLSKLPFIVANLILLLAAWVVFSQAAKPLTAAPLGWIALLVALAAGALGLPFLADYARAQDAALDERQRALEALARTTADTAEQIGIAAAGLHTITELAQKNLKAAEHLPQQLQEQLAALEPRQAKSATTEADALRQELAALRASETARLEAAIEQIARVAAELRRLETTPRQTRPTAENPAAKQSVKEVAVKNPPPVAVEASPKSEVFMSLPLVAESGPTIVAPPDTATPTEPPSPETANAVAAALAAADALLQEVSHEELNATIAPFSIRTKTAPKPAVKPEAEPNSGEPQAAPKRSKRAKSAEPAPAPAPASVPELDVPIPPPPRNSGDTHPILELGIGDDTPLSPTGSISNEATPPPFAFTRKKPVPQPTPTVVTELPGATDESALSSDGATRLLVTAYIGIGNKLFIRGDGPGLSPDKGVTLSFVSIGKWRWETADATGPVTVRLYKNDQQECTTLGPITLAPGRQREVTADF